MAENHAFTDLINRRGFWCPVHNVKILPTGCDVQCSRPVAERGAPTCGYGCTARLAQGLTPPKGGEESPAQRQDEPATQERGAWPLIRERAGVASQSGLAKRIKCTQDGVQSFLNQLRKGRAPSGAVAATVLKLTGLDMAELLAAEGHAMQQAEAQQPQPTQLAQSLGAVLGVDPAQELREAESETEPESSSAAPAASSPPAGAAESFSPATPATSVAPSGPAATSPAGPEGHQPEGIPADFTLLAAGKVFGAPEPEPVLAVTSKTIILSASAVRVFGLGQATHVDLYWSPARRMLGLRSVEPHAGAYKLQSRRGDGYRVISARSIRKVIGAGAGNRRYPITPGPGGLLVAKIEEAA